MIFHPDFPLPWVQFGGTQSPSFPLGKTSGTKHPALWAALVLLIRSSNLRTERERMGTKGTKALGRLMRALRIATPLREGQSHEA